MYVKCWRPLVTSLGFIIPQPDQYNSPPSSNVLSSLNCFKKSFDPDRIYIGKTLNSPCQSNLQQSITFTTVAAITSVSATVSISLVDPGADKQMQADITAGIM